MTKRALPGTITELRHQVETKALTIDDVRQQVRARLDANKDLNAFITVMLEDTSKGNSSLPLAGGPIGLKDFFDTAGIRTTAASEKYATRIPDQNADGDHIPRKLFWPGSQSLDGRSRRRWFIGWFGRGGGNRDLLCDHRHRCGGLSEAPRRLLCRNGFQTKLWPPLFGRNTPR